MNESKLFNGNFYFPDESGNWVSDKHQRIAEILQDYDPTLQLQWIPPDKRSKEDVAFRIVSFPDGGSPYLVCVADELDERLLAKVFDADQRNSPLKLTHIDNYNAALELVRAKEAEEKRKEDHELAAAVLRNRKSSFKHGGVDYERRRRST